MWEEVGWGLGAGRRGGRSVTKVGVLGLLDLVFLALGGGVVGFCFVFWGDLGGGFSGVFLSFVCVYFCLCLHVFMCESAKCL